MDFAKIRPRGGTKAQWEKANPVLAKREIGVQWETTIGVGEVVIKIGDGVTDWINLPEAVKSDITKKIIAALAVVPDDDPDLVDGDSLDTLFGKIAKKFKYLKDNKLDKSARYDGTDSTSTELVPTANALRGVNAKADKNASDITTLNNNLSNSGIPIVKKITDLYSIKTSGFYYYDAGTTNAPQSSRGGMIIANYLSDSWISLIVVPYASSKIYTNTKYNNTWVGWAESATKNDLGVFLTASGTKAAVFRGYVEITNLKLYARHTYLILGKAEASMTVSLIAAIIGFPSSDYGTSYSLGMSRSTGANGGGCVTAAIITLTKDCTISLQGYGYDNATYDYQGFLMAIQLK